MEYGFLRTVATALVTAALLALPGRAGAGIAIVSQSCTVNHATHDALFTLLLDAPPDFQTLDSAGRPANSFEYQLTTTWSGRFKDRNKDPFNVVFFGDEYASRGDLPIYAYDNRPDSPTPGFGSLLTEVPLTVDGSRLTFTVPLRKIGERDDIFTYHVFVTDFGATSSSRDVRVVPLPRSDWAAGFTVLVLGTACFGWKRLRRLGA